MSIIQGKEVNIYNSGGTVMIAAAKSCIINKSVDIYEVANPDSANSKKFKSGRSMWEISLSHLVTVDEGGIPLVGHEYTITYKVGGTSVFTGNAICQSAEITSTTGNLSQGSIKFRGTGDLTEV